MEATFFDLIWEVYGALCKGSTTLTVFLTRLTT